MIDNILKKLGKQTINEIYPKYREENLNYTSFNLVWQFQWKVTLFLVKQGVQCIII